MKTKLLITGLAFFAFTSFVNAQNNRAGQNQQTTPPVSRGVYVDSDNDGVCDNYGTRRLYNRNGQRMAGNASSGNRRGMAADQGRGIARGQGSGMGPGQGSGMGPGQGRGLAPGGRNFVDADKNGVCDYYETQAPEKK